MKKLVTISIAFMLCLVFWPSTASATSQWARKHKVECSLCHNGFPRLNTFGEEFMRNGYQMPGEESEAREYLTLGNISDVLGLRLNVTPVSAHLSSKTVVFGNPNWVQFFVAGAITKNISVFIENEITTSGAHFSWYKLGFHNLLGTKALNVTFGNLSPLDYSSFSNRLRNPPASKHEFFGIKSSRGKGEASVDASSARPGMMLFGDVGRFTYYTGLSTGVASPKSNNTMNSWVGARYNINASRIVGTNLSMTYYQGTDVKDGGKATQANNEFYWVMPAVNLRAGQLDFQAAARIGHEDNYLLESGSKVKADGYLGYGLVATYMMGRWQPALLYDKIASDAITGTGKELVTLSLSYYPAENIRLAGYYKRDAGDDGKDDQVSLNFRVMF